MKSQGVRRYALQNAENAVRAWQHHLAHRADYSCHHSLADITKHLAAARARLARLVAQQRANSSQVLPMPTPKQAAA